MREPKYKIGDNVVVHRQDKKYYLAQITEGYCEENGQDWAYWTSKSGDKDCFFWIKEKDIIKI